MTIEIIQKEDLSTLLIEGRLDTVTAKSFDVKIKEFLSLKSLKMVVDCSQLSYVSSSGLRCFLILQKSANAAGASLVLKGLSESIKEIFKITGFASIFTIEE